VKLCLERHILHNSVSGKLTEEFFLPSHSNWEAEGLTSALQSAISFSASLGREGETGAVTAAR